MLSLIHIYVVRCLAPESVFRCTDGERHEFMVLTDRVLRTYSALLGNAGIFLTGTYFVPFMLLPSPNKDITGIGRHSVSDTTT